MPYFIPLLLVLMFDPPSNPIPLTIGDVHPSFSEMIFVKGESIKELKNGTVYVIEFSGTQCVPCTKFIPQFDLLQKKYPEVVFISVYSENEKTVQDFIKTKANDVSFRIATDTKRAMWKKWSDAALQTGIPHVFVVGTGGKIEWIGNPYSLADPLSAIIAGKYDPQAQSIQVRVEQLAVLRSRLMEEKGTKEYERINDLVIAGKFAEALSATNLALVAYKDSPHATKSFRYMQLGLLSKFPEKREEAFELGFQLTVQAKMSERWMDSTNMVRSLLETAESSKLQDRDQRLVDLALALLNGDDPFDLLGKPESEKRDAKVFNLSQLGRAYHLKGDQVRAASCIQELIQIIEAQKPPVGMDATEFAISTEKQLKKYRAILKEYSAGLPNPEKK